MRITLAGAAGLEPARKLRIAFQDHRYERQVVRLCVYVSATRPNLNSGWTYTNTALRSLGP